VIQYKRMTSVSLGLAPRLQMGRLISCLITCLAGVGGIVGATRALADTPSASDASAADKGFLTTCKQGNIGEPFKRFELCGAFNVSRWDRRLGRIDQVGVSDNGNAFIVSGVLGGVLYVPTNDLSRATVLVSPDRRGAKKLSISPSGWVVAINMGPKVEIHRPLQHIVAVEIAMPNGDKTGAVLVSSDEKYVFVGRAGGVVAVIDIDARRIVRTLRSGMPGTPVSLRLLDNQSILISGVGTPGAAIWRW
jgi:hypothetical protein